MEKCAEKGQFVCLCCCCVLYGVIWGGKVRIEMMGYIYIYSMWEERDYVSRKVATRSVDEEETAKLRLAIWGFEGMMMMD